MSSPQATEGAARASTKRTSVIVGLVFAAALMRLLPHPANLTPIGALALFGGAHFRSRSLAFAVPLFAMLASDVVLFAAFGWGFNSLTVAVYASTVFAALLGHGMLGRITPAQVAGRSLLAAVAFFLVTNAAVWLTAGLYPVNASGLVACFVAAIPFFGNTLAGHALYGAVLFGGFALLQRRFEVLRLGVATGVATS